MAIVDSGEHSAAWALPETRSAWRRAALWAAVWLVSGIVLFAGIGVYATSVADRSAALKADGTKVIATVFADQPDSLRCNQVDVPVRFTLNGVQRSENLSVDGCGGGTLLAGDQVALFVDPANPSRFVSEQSDNEDAFAVTAMCIAFILSVVLVVASLVRAVRLVRTRGALRSGPWVEHSAREVNLRGKFRDHVPVIALTDEMPVELQVLRWPASRGVPNAGPSVVVARSPRGWAVVASDPGGVLRSAHAANERLARKALIGFQPGGPA